MSDTFDSCAIANLEQDLSKLGMTKFEADTNTENESLVNDPVFKSFQAALKEKYSDLPDLWQETFALQVYPDPIEYLLPVNYFSDFFRVNEPGSYTDYKGMRENLHKFQDYVPGGEQAVSDMYSFINTFTGYHVQFVRASTAMHGYHLYSKMAERFYGHIRDPAFEDFIEETIEDTGDISIWPSYESVQTALSTNLNAARISMQQAAQELFYLKVSDELIQFNANIEAAKNVKQSADAERILAKYIGSQTRAERARRKSAVVRRNLQANKERVTKNNGLRRRNAGNIHQFGCMARTPISGPVLRALNVLQEKYSGEMFDDEEAETEIEADMEEEMVATKMKGLSVAAKFGGGDEESMEEVMKVQEPMGGIIVAEGYHTFQFL